MKVVYLLYIWGEYEGVFSSKEKALEYLKKVAYDDHLKSRYNIDEVIIDELINENR